MRLLILANNYEFYPPFSAVHAYIQELCKVFPGSQVYGPGFPDYDTNDVVVILEQLGGADKFDAVYCFSLERPLLNDLIHEAVIINNPKIPVALCTFPMNLGKVRLPKLLQPADFWHCTPAEWACILSKHGFDYVNSSMLPPFIAEQEFHKTFPADIQDRVLFIPSGIAVDPNRFKNFGLPKDHTVIMAGKQYPEFYPVRAQMREAFHQANIGLFEPQHPGYGRFFRKNPYPLLLNSSRISAFCSGRFNQAMAKLIEAMACNCAAMCNFFHGAEHMGLVPGAHFILADETTCVAEAKKYLREPQRLQEMYAAAEKIVRERHTFEIRAIEMAQWLPALINHEKPVSWATLIPNMKAVKARNRRASDFTLAPTTYTTAHVVDEKLDCRQSTWHYWNKLGTLKKFSPEESENREFAPPLAIKKTAFSWVQIFCAEYLAQLACSIQATNILEIGTGMGFQSFVWAGQLIESQRDGCIVTLDTVGQNAVFECSSPLLQEWRASRMKLWDKAPEAARIQFIHRGHEPIPAATPFDLVFIDQENTFDSVLTDFAEIRPLLHPASVVVINNYCDRAPGVMDAVNYLSKKEGMGVHHVTFLPEPEGMAVCRFASYQGQLSHQS